MNFRSTLLRLNCAALIVAAAVVITVVLAGADRERQSEVDPLSDKSPALQNREMHTKRKGVSTVRPGGIAGGPANDDCANALPVTSGNTSFSTIGATTDGLSHPECLSFGDDNVNQDIWFTYIPIQTDVFNLSLCGSLYDTRVAIYDGCGVCPPTDLLFCNDDSCGLQSQISGISGIAGTCYTIRIGGYDIGAGEGILNLSVAIDRICGGTDHDCCVTGSHGCNDVACCEAVCSQDSFCCEIKWDIGCVNLADQLCAEPCPSPCSKDNPQDCFVPGKLPGCNRVFCCEQICSFDPFCCQIEWDQICASEAGQMCDFICTAECPPGAVLEVEPCGADMNGGCNSLTACDGPFPDCCHATGAVGCSDPVCAAAICAVDPFCCKTQWDALCAQQACANPECECDPTFGDPFQTIECGDTICGTQWSSRTLRDTDWYRFGVEGCGTIATWTVSTTFPSIIAILSGSCPTVVLATTVAGCPELISAELFPGTYFAYVAPAAFVNFPCDRTPDANEYFASLTCDGPCPGDINEPGGGPA